MGEDPSVRIGIVGAGVSGLACARTLRAAGFDVVVYDRAPDLGGVWSRTRTYPGVSTQDDRRSYSFSDLPMPEDFAEHPSGAEVRSYLEAYARTHGLEESLRLQTEVVAAEPWPDERGWLVRSRGPEGDQADLVDYLVVANGVYCRPHVPDWPGRAAFEAAGGRVLTPAEVGDGSALAQARLVVVGWGKTACDLATAGSAASRSTTVVARNVSWKLPKRLGRHLTFRHLLLTRLGEHVMATPHRTRLGRLVFLATWAPRFAVSRRLRGTVTRQLGLEGLGLRPRTPLSFGNSLVTEGFFEAVAEGRITTLPGRQVRSLGVVDGTPTVELSDGALLPADVVLAATGYDQVVDLLDEPTRRRLLEPDGSLRLHRKILPTRVAQLAFVGWSQSYRSPLLAEIQSVWLVAHLLGQLRLPEPDRRQTTAPTFLLTHERVAVAHAPQVPSGSFGELDELLEDLDLRLPLRTRLEQLVVPLDPASYADLLPRVLARAQRAPAVPRRRGRRRPDLDPVP